MRYCKLLVHSGDAVAFVFVPLNFFSSYHNCPCWAHKVVDYSQKLKRGNTVHSLVSLWYTSCGEDQRRGRNRYEPNAISVKKKELRAAALNATALNATAPN
jgi:hypothetical protein